MKTRIGAGILCAAVMSSMLGTSALVRAAPPNIDTPAPIIHLADNLDEKDNLGWCIDTVGRGFSERLHSHSCKPGDRPHGDVQFRYNPATRQIMSAEYANKCAELLSPAAVGGKLGLLDCSADSGLQRFDFDAASMEIRMGGSPDLCLVVGPNSRTAGPFMSRDLLLGNCDATEAKFKQWVVKSAN